MLDRVAAILEAVEIAGSQAKLAAKLAEHSNRPTIRQQTVFYWIKHETLIAAEYWAAFEIVTGGKVTRERLRPDVFPRAA